MRRSRLTAIFTLAVAAYIAASSPTAGVSAPTATEAISPAVARSSAAYCRDVRLIAVRGTNDNLNSYGWIGSKLGGALVARARAAGVTYGGYGLPYPARLRGYVESKNTGRDMLRAFIRVEVSTCPEQKLVLVGYSQGAHVVADVLSRGPSGRLTSRELSRIGAVVLIGDPRFNPDEPFTFGGFDVNRRGRLGARSPHDLDSVNGRIRAWCRRGDYWCQKPLPFGVSVRQAFAMHKQESYWTDYKDAIISFVVTKLNWQGAIPPPAEPIAGVSKFWGSTLRLTFTDQFEGRGTYSQAGCSQSYRETGVTPEGAPTHVTIGGSLNGGWTVAQPHDTLLQLVWQDERLARLSGSIALRSPTGELLHLAFRSNLQGCPTPLNLVPTSIGPAIRLSGRPFAYLVTSSGPPFTTVWITTYVSVEGSDPFVVTVHVASPG